LQACKQPSKVVPLSTPRISRSLERLFEIAVAGRGVTKRKAVEEALRLWIVRQLHALDRDQTFFCRLTQMGLMDFRKLGVYALILA
jgi:hypothetical protein